MQDSSRHLLNCAPMDHSCVESNKDRCSNGVWMLVNDWIAFDYHVNFCEIIPFTVPVSISPLVAWPTYWPI